MSDKELSPQDFFDIYNEMVKNDVKDTRYLYIPISDSFREELEEIGLSVEDWQRWLDTI